MAKASFAVGILDKAARNVKTEKGWVPIKGNESLIDWNLDENKRHAENKDELLKEKPAKEKKSPPKEKQSVSAKAVGDLKDVLNGNGTPKKKGTAAPKKKEEKDETAEVKTTWQKEQYDWGKNLAVKVGDKCVLSLTEDNIKAAVLGIIDAKAENKAVVEFKDKDGNEGIMMNWSEKQTIKVILKNNREANYFLPYLAFDFSKGVADFTTHVETKEEKAVKKETVSKNNKARHQEQVKKDKKNTPPKHAK